MSARNGGRELNGGGFPAGGSSRRDGERVEDRGEQERQDEKERKRERGGRERERPQPIV